MKPVLGIISVVSQFVHHNLVGREIVHPLGMPLLHLIDGKEQRGLAQLRAVPAVFPVAEGTQGEGNPYEIGRAHV